MAREKFVITSECRIDGQVHKKGSTIDLDIEDAREGQKIALLNRAGRLLPATKQNVDMIQREAKAEEEREKNFARMAQVAPAPA